MAETQTLNFGPEWLRALSGGGSGGIGGGGISSSTMASPPLSPALPKYKLADYRYGREEMLALYVKDNKIPIDLHDKEFLPILQEEPLLPLALVSFTEEEQRNFSMSVNSAAVLRLNGRGSGGGPVVGAPRGRSTSRGRGRGRGDGGFYQRSFDDVEGFGRGGREMHRSQSWEERGDRRFEKPGRKDPDAATGHFQMNHVRNNYDDAGVGLPRKHDFTRSESENWRTSRDDQNDGARSSAWHPEQRRRLQFDSRDDERSYRRPRSGSGSLDDDRDALPEWCLEDADEEAGTFDSSGAFLSHKQKASKEPILEEAELDFKPLEECEEALEEEDSQPKETKEIETEAKQDSDQKVFPGVSRMSEEPPSVLLPAALPIPEAQATPKSESPSLPHRTEEPERPAERQPPLERLPETCNVSLHVPMSNSMSLPMTRVASTHTEVRTPLSTIQKPMEVPLAMNNPLPFSSSVLAPIGRPAAMPQDTDEDEGLKHFEQEAEKMVAYLQDGVVDDDRLTAKTPEKAKPAGLPLTHKAALKWFYKDPQGEIQGPFSNQEMAEWFQAGYFTMSLLVKRGCDDIFQALGEMMKIWGRVPFSPGPAPPPLQGDADQERLKRQQELTALNLYQLQQLQYQYLLRQQYAQAVAQQKAAVLSSAPLQQQQQHQQQLNLLQQQYQALKIRTSESLLPPVTRSLSVPDSGSVWEMQNPSSQASCTPNIPPATSSTWDSSSVWDLPIDSMAKAPTIEQMQQLEKSKAAKLELERREAEMRAKREEEERKRLEEALRARQEEERKRLEEEELARQKQEEALRRQREQEEAHRRKKEEEERLAQEEALRKLEERRREEEERKKREEFLRKQEEERRKQEELEALKRREEEKRAEEEAAAAAAAAAAALAQQQQEEQKRREQEAQRQQELQRQRQQQQEALRRLQQQQQLAQMKLPLSSKWGHQSANTSNKNQNTLSLAEIQKLEEERERLALVEQQRQQQELLKMQQHQALQQAQQAQAKLSGWGHAAKQAPVTKSLLEIQREEAQQMKQKKEQPSQQQQQQQQQPQNALFTQPTRPQNRTPSMSNSVWGSVNTSPCSNWVSDSSSIWGDTHNSNMGFWDEAVKEAVHQPPPTRKGNAQKNKGNANLSNSSGRANKKVEEEEKLLKLFQGVNKSQQDGFMQWCEHTLHSLNTANNLDVPTFASFLKEVDSPYEVHDYVRAYLGDTAEAKDFAKQFLERRAKQNANQQKTPPLQNQPQALKQQQDSVWGGTGSSTLYQANHTSGQQKQQQQHQQQQQRFETVTSGKKKKKQKMVRADPSLLGFSVNASSERLNMGEIETLEDF
ncbi:GRB10-interacting GYF protein 2 isoform X1 [Corythoichthys intestinalis]|uniref:GRB10-interacting GYF protein 2 isoform X1 n=1 Tax=Corythoichthys intestinalis TaxID=161448 RepID=UPI0025A55746|nr:GRB10-interacting GYF protein 2 isoform X1 [Corythoichthys intestinalis]XP_057713305.1 GRB10-interacting GYF protein 2 isoform X1 [Corythoichthys intestinalis]XP_057713306.1 GRB10-interacting GYF protein 2 isoform X1 [Corythoichthys intestinalis]